MKYHALPNTQAVCWFQNAPSSLIKVLISPDTPCAMAATAALPCPCGWYLCHGCTCSSALPMPAGTCAVLLQPPDLGMQALERAGMLPLQEQQVLLGTVQLVLQVCGCHADIQVACRKDRGHCHLLALAWHRLDRRPRRPQGTCCMPGPWWATPAPRLVQEELSPVWGSLHGPTRNRGHRHRPRPWVLPKHSPTGHQ